jgi:hypothetical protein
LTQDPRDIAFAPLIGKTIFSALIQCSGLEEDILFQQRHSMHSCDKEKSTGCENLDDRCRRYSVVQNGTTISKTPVRLKSSLRFLAKTTKSTIHFTF